MISIFRGSRVSDASPAAGEAGGNGQSSNGQNGAAKGSSSAGSNLGSKVPAGRAHALNQLSESVKDHLIQAKGLNHAELGGLLGEISMMAESLRPDTELLDATARACTEVETYFARLGTSIDSVGMDLATSIRALATLLHGSGENQEQFLGKMEQIRDTMQKGHTLDNIQQLRQHLDSCLTSLRAELFEARKAHQEQKAAILERLSLLHRSVSTLRASVPQKHAAGPALSILRIRRLKAVKDRYGADVAQRLMDYVIQILLVRWPAAYDITPYGEECLVVVDSHNLDLDFHRSALRKLTSEKNVFSLTRNGEEISLPLAMDWTVIRAPADEDMSQFIQNFLDGMAQKDSQAANLDRALGIR